MPSPSQKKGAAAELDEDEQPVHCGKLLVHLGDPRDPNLHGTWSQQYIVLYADVIEYGGNKKMVQKVHTVSRSKSLFQLPYSDQNNMNINVGFLHTLIILFFFT